MKKIYLLLFTFTFIISCNKNNEDDLKIITGKPKKITFKEFENDKVYNISINGISQITELESTDEKILIKYDYTDVSEILIIDALSNKIKKKYEYIYQIEESSDPFFIPYIINSYETENLDFAGMIEIKESNLWNSNTISYAPEINTYDKNYELIEKNYLFKEEGYDRLLTYNSDGLFSTSEIRRNTSDIFSTKSYPFYPNTWLVNLFKNYNYEFISSYSIVDSVTVNYSNETVENFDYDYTYIDNKISEIILNNEIIVSVEYELIQTE